MPIVIAADWNNLSDKNRELVCAKLTGDWVEALEHIVETTDDIKASKDLKHTQLTVETKWETELFFHGEQTIERLHS